MNKENKKIGIGMFLRKLTSNDILLITTVTYIVLIAIYEMFYCNFEYFTEMIPTYNFSLYRIIVYLAVYIIFYKLKDTFINGAIEGFQSKLKCLLVDVVLILSLWLFSKILIIMITDKTFNLSMSLMLIFTLIMNILVIYISNNILKNILVTALLIGTFFSITITFNNQLDEKRHFLSSYSIAVRKF